MSSAWARKGRARCWICSMVSSGSFSPCVNSASTPRLFRMPSMVFGSKLRAKLVMTAPGSTFTTRMGSSSSSLRSVVASRFTAALVAP